MLWKTYHVKYASRVCIESTNNIFQRQFWRRGFRRDKNGQTVWHVHVSAVYIFFCILSSHHIECNIIEARGRCMDSVNVVDILLFFYYRGMFAHKQFRTLDLHSTRIVGESVMRVTQVTGDFIVELLLENSITNGWFVTQIFIQHLNLIVVWLFIYTIKTKCLAHHLTWFCFFIFFFRMKKHCYIRIAQRCCVWMHRCTHGWHSKSESARKMLANSNRLIVLPQQWPATA